MIGDQATQRAIDLDQKHGVSSKFLQTLHNLDKKYQVFIFTPNVRQNVKLIANYLGYREG